MVLPCNPVCTSFYIGFAEIRVLLCNKENNIVTISIGFTGLWSLMVGLNTRQVQSILTLYNIQKVSFLNQYFFNTDKTMSTGSSFSHHT